MEDVFRADDGVLPNARGGFDDDAESSLVDARFPWERPMPPPEAAARAARSPAWMAELTLPEPELRRLRHAAMRIKSKTQVGGAGVTREIVAKIKEKWRTDEVIRVKVNGTPALNMRLFHEILEVCIRFCQNRLACIELVFGNALASYWWKCLITVTVLTSLVSSSLIVEVCCDLRLVSMSAR